MWPFDDEKWVARIEESKRFKNFMNSLLHFATKGEYKLLMEQSREKYYSRVGRPFEDDQDYIQRMNTFIEWFVFDYKPEGEVNGAIWQRYMSIMRESAKPSEMLYLAAISKQKHSIFEVKAKKPDILKVKDIIFGETHFVTCDDMLEVGDLLESRIVTVEDGSFFTYSNCVHPRVAMKPLKIAIKEKRKEHLINSDFFLQLAAMQLKWRRSRQIDVNHIYKFE